MAVRTITDSAGRTWTCAPAADGDGSEPRQGKDVLLRCTTPSVTEPVEVRVGWQWESMSPNGLARLINDVSPVPRR
jgi:hypothetical protein